MYMRKLLQTITATIVGACLMAGVASADSVTCGNISNTGQGSTNTVTCVDTNTNIVSCVNNVVVSNINTQSSNSGSATSSGNTSGGNASSGSAGNSNNVVVNVGASCTPQGTTAFVTTPVGGKGGGTPAAPVAAAPAVAPVAALPDTGSNSVVDTAVAGVIGIAGILAVSQLGVQAYRRFALK
jgi:hypothetical protein